MMKKNALLLERYRGVSLVVIIALLIAASSIGYAFLSYRNSKNQLISIKSELYSTEQKLQTTKDDMTSIQSDLQSFKEELASYKTRLQTLADELTNTETRLEETEFNLEAEKIKLEKTQNKLTDTETALKTTQTELTAEKETSDRLKSKNEILEDDLGQLSRNTVINRGFVWTDNFAPYKQWSYTMRMNRVDYLGFVTKNHPYNIDYKMINNFVSPHDPVVKNISDTLVNHYPDSEDLAEHVLGFVQSLPYEEDIDEYPRYPLETLVEGGGDCEDKSILYASLMKSLGYDVALLDYYDHVIVGIAFPDPVPSSIVDMKSYAYEGKRYYTAETTMPYWRLGELREIYMDMEPRIYPV